MIRIFSGLAAALITGAVAAQAVDRSQLESRIAAVKTLLNNSTAARQIEASGNARALERREAARAIHRQAEEAFRSGELDRSSRLLPEASVLMFEAVRQAAPERVVQGKAASDFEARMESVKSLLAAHKRISSEKPDAERSAETSRAIEHLMGEARRMADAGRIEEGRNSLDQAYLVAKASISSMRSGDTLVRSLNFATKEEEYRYEIDRNDTHQMLIKVLLGGRANIPGSETRMRTFVDRSAQLRTQAESAAGKAEYAVAIRFLEDSTTELVRAIRNAGIYIPGQ